MKASKEPADTFKVTLTKFHSIQAAVAYSYYSVCYVNKGTKIIDRQQDLLWHEIYVWHVRGWLIFNANIAIDMNDTLEVG